jgi:hypothetical protein
MEAISTLMTVGQGLILAGAAGVIGAMLFGTTENGINSVFFRGSFQEAKDYTPRGWRFYKAAFWCTLTGFALFAMALLLALNASDG